MKDKKLIIRKFVDFEKEEQWLNNMCKSGWAFWHTNGFIYRFKSCTPGESVYQIDYDEDKGASGEDYVVFRNSCGDQFVHQWKDKIYWKRPSADGPFESKGNDTTKLRVINKAFEHYWNILIVWCALYILSELIGVLVLALSNISTLEYILTLNIAFASGIIVLLPILIKLRKKMNRLISDLF